MKFKIQHYNVFIGLISVGITFVFMFLCFIIPSNTIRLILLALAFLAIIVGVIISIIERNTGTEITITQDGYIEVRNMFENRRIHINEITNITIERYEIRRALGKYSHYQEQRLKMRITPTIGKNIILTDTATIVDRALIRRLSDINYLQNENVPLYQAYQVIRSMRGD